MYCNYTSISNCLRLVKVQSMTQVWIKQGNHIFTYYSIFSRGFEELNGTMYFI